MMGVLPVPDDPKCAVGRYEVTALPPEGGVWFFASYQPVNVAVQTV